MRQEAEVLRRNLCPREAELLGLWAAEFAARVEQDENELLTRPEARRYSPYSEAQFRVLEREGKIVAIVGACALQQVQQRTVAWLRKLCSGSR